MERRAKLFMTGRSQAVRLPKEFRFPGTEVRVTKIGDEVVLTPVGTRAIAWTAIDAIGDAEFMREGREQPEMPPERETFAP